MSYVAEYADLTACPGCGSGRIACVVGLQRLHLDFCMSCLKTWEQLPAGEPYTTDGEQLPFDVPCDNCAFRGRSQERQDVARWNDLQETLARGGQFFCHKAVPFDPCQGEGERGFEFPRKTSRLDIAGKCVPYDGYDRDRMRLCRGFLNRFIGGLARD